MSRRQPPTQLRLVPRSGLTSRSCSRCRLTLPATEFDRLGHEQRRWCRACMREVAGAAPARAAA